jgi:hypothetical protein
MKSDDAKETIQQAQRRYGHGAAWIFRENRVDEPARLPELTRVEQPVRVDIPPRMPRPPRPE